MKDCAACGGGLADFLDLGASPLADSFPADAAVEQRWYPLVVAVCPGCWLVQLREVVPDGELYGEDYGFRSGASPAAVRYFEKLAEQLLGRYAAQVRGGVAEIASNDGTLLKCFADAGHRVLGIEPSAAADDASVPTLKEPFSLGLSLDMDRFGLVLAFNVAAHVADPLDFLVGVKNLLADDGVAVVEFQDLAALIAGCQFDHVYHEHRFYYSLTTFSTLAAKAGLVVTSWERTPAQGGSVRVHLRRGAGIRVREDPWLQDMAVYRTMQGRAEYSRDRLLSLVWQELLEDRVVAGYGASAKSATLLNFSGLTSRQVSWVEDITPGKIGRVTPGSKIPVRAPGTWPDTYLLLSWNYAGPVIRKQSEFLREGGRLLVPGAVPVLL